MRYWGSSRRLNVGFGQRFGDEVCYEGHGDQKKVVYV